MANRLVIALTLWAAASAAPASTVNFAQVGVNPNFSGGTGPFNDFQNNSGVAEIISPLVTGGDASSGHAASRVDYLGIKLSGDSAGSLNSVARGIIRNELIFTAPGVAKGTLADVTFSISVNGTLDVGPLGGSTAAWQLQADLGGGQFDLNKSAHLFGADPIFVKHGYVGDPFGTYAATVTIQLGFAMPLDIELTGSAQTSFQDSGSSPSAFDLAHSLYWGGISELKINGIDVPDFDVSSASGTPYRAAFTPVPLPPAALMCGPALVLLRRRRSLVPA